MRWRIMHNVPPNVVVLLFGGMFLYFDSIIFMFDQIVDASRCSADLDEALVASSMCGESLNFFPAIACLASSALHALEHIWVKGCKEDCCKVGLNLQCDGPARTPAIKLSIYRIMIYMYIYSVVDGRMKILLQSTISTFTVALLLPSERLVWSAN